MNLFIKSMYLVTCVCCILTSECLDETKNTISAQSSNIQAQAEPINEQPIVQAAAKHILIPFSRNANGELTPDAKAKAKKIKDDIESKRYTFDEAARRFSTCPSKKNGGDLGSFTKGTMVPEFEQVVFSHDTKLNTVYGPIPTEFGYHLILVYDQVTE